MARWTSWGSNISTGSITIGAGSQLYSEGTLAFATNGASSIDPTAHFGSRNIVLAVGTVIIGDPGTIAAAGAPTGLRFDQALFNTLVSGDPLHGAPALKTITLSAAGAINLFGSTGLDATGSGVDLVLNTPAIYGYGTADDHSVIAANKITWNGIPGATVPADRRGRPEDGQRQLRSRGRPDRLRSFHLARHFVQRPRHLRLRQCRHRRPLADRLGRQQQAVPLPGAERRSRGRFRSERHGWQPDAGDLAASTGVREVGDGIMPPAARSM